MTLDHLCRQHRCVNPDHLEVVTTQVNIQRGRLAKLTPEAVREIRARAAAGAPQGRLAQQFGVNQSTISRIVTGARGDWSNVA
jgi:DNA-binding XRE family transcriptional regulator